MTALFLLTVYLLLQGYSIDWCKGPDRGLVAPDVVFYLDAPLKTIAARGGYGDERYETNKFQEKVYNAYKELEDASWKVQNIFCLFMCGCLYST